MKGQTSAANGLGMTIQGQRKIRSDVRDGADGQRFDRSVGRPIGIRVVRPDGNPATQDVAVVPVGLDQPFRTMFPHRIQPLGNGRQTAEKDTAEGRNIVVGMGSGKTINQVTGHRNERRDVDRGGGGHVDTETESQAGQVATHALRGSKNSRYLAVANQNIVYPFELPPEYR